MADEARTKLRLEIAHVLFMDIVGYTKLGNEEQSEALQRLNGTVLDTEAVREEAAAGRLLRLPTGDGMALVFTSSVEAPVECALQISRALRGEPGLPLRMGIHSGPVQQMEDVNRHANVAGVGINTAQRVMDCGDVGHILVSKRVADDLAASRHWRPYLHDLGDCVVKHGVVVSLTNLYAEEVGNPAPPARFGEAGGREPALAGPPSAARNWRLAAGGLAVAAAVGFALWHGGRAGRPAAAAPPGLPMAAVPVPPEVIPEKSIAVLPFANLSDDKANGYFAEGIQDEILTDLARVAALKVISRTSVMVYGTDRAGHNVREIGRALGVSHVLEGSVQRFEGRVRVNAQLIDTRTDAHLWAERYDREAADIFAIQSEIAERIVASLRARLSPDEKAAIDARPTTDVGAYDLYLQAKELVASYQETQDWRGTLLRAVRLLDEALARDGDFALAWCLAARAHDELYFNGLDPTPLRLALEEKAVAAAERLAPKLGEVRLARALLLYHGKRDYAATRAELALASAALPNSAQVASLTSYLDRRQGRWPEALREQDRALSLDPRNLTILSEQTIIYDMLRRYREEIRTADRIIADLPASADYYRVVKATALLAAGQPRAARTVLGQLPPGYDPYGAATYARVCGALYEGRPEEAAQALRAFQGEEYPGINGTLTPRGWLEALVARAAGDGAAAARALTRARGPVEASTRARPEDAGAWSLLGLIDAGLGRKEEALRAGRRAVELRPVETDAMDGPSAAGALAMIHAWTGEADEAMRLLNALATKPGGPDYGQLRYDPAWAGLRARADFQAMLAELDPKMDR